MAEPLPEPPPGWLVLVCNRCPTSVAWTREDMQDIDDNDDWFAVLHWATSEVEHDMQAHDLDDHSPPLTPGADDG